MRHETVDLWLQHFEHIFLIEYTLAKDAVENNRQKLRNFFVTNQGAQDVRLEV